jgi:hypothetical protein
MLCSDGIFNVSIDQAKISSNIFLCYVSRSFIMESILIINLKLKKIINLNINN